MHYCMRPKVECNGASGRPGYRVLYYTNRHEITVLLPNPFDEILSSVSLAVCRAHRGLPVGFLLLRYSV